MAKRVSITKQTQTEVLTKSRRRCCICFGLNRDEGLKKGQIAHLDKDSNNNKLDNLAYLCLEHHDEYDSTTSQSKGISLEEAKKYREELYGKFSIWGIGSKHYQLLNFLAFDIDLETLADAAIKAGGSVLFYGEEHAIDVLTSAKVIYSDWDLLGPHLMVLDIFASWGLLTYESEEIEINEFPHMQIIVEHKEICEDIANLIRKRLKTKTD